MGAVAVGATIYFGSAGVAPPDLEVSMRFQQAHELGMATILVVLPPQPGIQDDDKDYHISADLTGQANHLGVTIQADIIKQKLPRTTAATPLEVGKTSPLVYEKLTTDHPIDLCRYQVANGYMGGRLDQFGRRIVGRIGPGRSGSDGGHQQTGRRHGLDQRSQGVPASHVGGGAIPRGDSGRLPRQEHHRGVTLAMHSLNLRKARVAHGAP